MVDIRVKAEEMGVEIIEKEHINAVRGAVFQIKEKWYITIDKNDTEERLAFTIAHELSEIMLHDNEELTSDEKHQRSNILASELLMPEEDFKRDVFYNDLYQLKEIYRNCSYEAISRRTLVFIDQVLTIFDNKRKYLRIGPESVSFPSLPGKGELEAAEECYRLKNKYEKLKDNLKITGYFVDNGRGIERVILFTEVLDM